MSDWKPKNPAPKPTPKPRSEWRPGKHVEMSNEVHRRLTAFQITIFQETGEMPTKRSTIGLLLDREALYRERLLRLGKMDKGGEDDG